MTEGLILPLGSGDELFLRDESRRTGAAESISFPRGEEEVRHLLRIHQKDRIPVTLQGGRTGIAGGAVPSTGHILNLSRMNRILGLSRRNGGKAFTLHVEPGISLTEVRTALKHKRFPVSTWDSESCRILEEMPSAGPLWFPPDPTETSATLGGMAACNASGAMSFRYGATRCHIDSLRVVLMDGDVLSLKRGVNKATGRFFSLRTGSGRKIEGCLPRYLIPAVKSAAGFFHHEDMDLIDLFLGMEGTLGVITELGLRLSPEPAARIGVVVFLPEEEGVLNLVKLIRAGGGGELPKPVAMEFLNSRTLDLLRLARAEGSAFGGLPEIKEQYGSALYLEFHGTSKDTLEGEVLNLEPMLKDLGGSGSETWCGENFRHIETLKEFRHAPPEAVNLQIDRYRQQCPGLTKLGTDMSVKEEDLEWVMSLYNHDLRDAGLDYVIFGHIGDNHLHVNILPRTLEEYARGRELYMNWARKIVSRGGSVSAEHGIGKLKAPYLELMVGPEGIEEMRSLKALFDSENLLGQGTLFSFKDRGPPCGVSG